MRLRLTLTLLLLNLLLAGVIWYLDKEARAAEEFARASRQVFRPALGEVQRVEWHLGGEHRWTVERRAEDWHLLHPQSWPANPFAVTRLLNQLEFLRAESRIPAGDLAAAGQQAADWGLAPARGQLRLRAGALPAETLLEIGDPTRMGGNLYVRDPGGADILVVGGELLTALEAPLEEWRQPGVFQIPAFEIRSLSLQITQPGNLTVRLARHAGGWRFEAPLQVEADPREVQVTLQGLAGLEAADFPNPDAAAQGLGAPPMRLTIEGNNRRQTLLLGSLVPSAQPPRFFARLGDNATVFTVPAEPLNNLRVLQERLREKRLLGREAVTVIGLRIEGGARPVALQRLESGQWQLVAEGPDGGLTTLPAETPMVQALVDRLLQVEAVSFLSDAPSEADLAAYELDQPQRRVEIRTAQGVRVLRLGAFDPANSLLFAKLEDAPFVYQVRPDLLGLLRTRALDYRRRALHELPAGATVVSAEVRDLADGRPLFSLNGTGPEPAWPGAPDALPEAQARAWAALRAALRRMEARDLVLSPFDEAGFARGGQTYVWRHELTVRVALAGGDGTQEQTLRYLLANRAGGTVWHAGAPAADVVFTLPDALLEAFSLLLAEPLPAPPEDSPPARAAAPEPAAPASGP